MNNTLESLNNYLFESIEKLNDDELSDEALEKEIKRSEAISKIAKTIIDNGHLALAAQKHFDDMGSGTIISNPLLGVCDANIIAENKGLRKRILKLESY